MGPTRPRNRRTSRRSLPISSSRRSMRAMSWCMKSFLQCSSCDLLTPLSGAAGASSQQHGHYCRALKPTTIAAAVVVTGGKLVTMTGSGNGISGSGLFDTHDGVDDRTVAWICEWLEDTGMLPTITVHQPVAPHQHRIRTGICELTKSF
jgi:hypothetical protein